MSEYGMVIFSRNIETEEVTAEHTGPDLIKASTEFLHSENIDVIEGNRFELGGLRFEIVREDINSWHTWICRVLHE